MLCDVQGGRRHGTANALPEGRCGLAVDKLALDAPHMRGAWHMICQRIPHAQQGSDVTVLRRAGKRGHTVMLAALPPCSAGPKSTAELRREAADAKVLAGEPRWPDGREMAVLGAPFTTFQGSL